MVVETTPGAEEGYRGGGQGEEGKVTDHLTPCLVKENRLDSLDCDQLYYPPHSPFAPLSQCRAIR